MKKLVLMIIPALICGAVLLLSQCKMSNSSKPSAGDLIEIDIAKEYPEKELYIQDIAKIEYIPLETNKVGCQKCGFSIKIFSSDFCSTLILSPRNSASSLRFSA